MASKYWIKLYHEIIHDPKMCRLSDRLYRRCIELFLIAGETDDEGFLPNVDDIAWTLRMGKDDLETDMADLASHGILHKDSGRWIVSRVHRFLHSKGNQETLDGIVQSDARGFRDGWHGLGIGILDGNVVILRSTLSILEILETHVVVFPRKVVGRFRSHHETSTRLDVGLAHELHVLVLKRRGRGDETTVVIVEVPFGNDIFARGAPAHVKGMGARLGGEMDLLTFQHGFVNRSFGRFQQQPTTGTLGDGPWNGTPEGIEMSRFGNPLSAVDEHASIQTVLAGGFANVEEERATTQRFHLGLAVSGVVIRIG